MKKVIIAVAIALVAVAGFFAARFLADRKLPGFSKSIDIYVYPDESPSAVLDSIIAGGAVRREGSLRRAFRHEGALDAVQPGHYTVGASSSVTYLARMLKFGWQTPVNLTLSGSIRSRGSLAKKIGAQMLVDSAEVASALNVKTIKSTIEDGKDIVKTLKDDDDAEEEAPKELGDGEE